MWEVVAGPFIGHTDQVNSVGFSRGGKYVVSGLDDKSVIIWNAKSGEVLRDPFEGHADAVNCVSFSPDGKHVETVKGPLEGHTTGAVRSAIFSPDGKRLVSGSDVTQLGYGTLREAR